MTTRTRILGLGLVLAGTIMLSATGRAAAQDGGYTPPGFYNPVPVHQPYQGIPFNYGGYHPHYTPQLYQPTSSYGHYRGYESSNGIFYPGWRYNGRPAYSNYPSRGAYYNPTGGFGYGPAPETAPR